MPCAAICQRCAEVIVQEDFQLHGGTLLEKLEEYIANCDRVIALVGSAYGYEPELAAAPKNSPARSYTQWEYYFAIGERLDGSMAAAKPIYVYFASADYLEAHAIEQTDKEYDRQLQFIDAIKVSDRDRGQFHSIDNLARLVLRDGFRLQGPEKYLLQNLPFDSLGTMFKGRDEFFLEIKTQLTTGDAQATAVVAKQAIHGLGGVGKTRMAVEYAWRYQLDYSACLFINADSPENLARNLAALCSARVLNLPEQAAQEQEQQVAPVLRWFNTHPGWLLILDNVDTPEAAAVVDQLLPALQNGHVLITSRLTDWGSNIHSLALDTLNEEDAADFLLEKTASRRTPEDDDKTVAHSLAQTLGGLALALEQASSFINKKRISLHEYLGRWTQQEVKLRHWHDPRTMNYPTSLAVTWETSFELLSPSAQALLNLLSCFAPDPIPRKPFAEAFNEKTLAELLTEVASKDESGTEPADLPDLEDLLDELATLSLMKWESGNTRFSIHRLVQEITQTRLEVDSHKNALLVALHLINSAIPSDPPPNDVRSWGIWEPLRAHIERLVHTADAVGITEPTSLLMNELGQYLKAKSLLLEAEPLMQRALAIDEASLGADHPTVARDLNNLAQLLQATNRLDEAEPLMQRALAIDEDSFGAEHPRVAIDLNNLAQLLQATNRLDEAEPLMRRALAIDEDSFGAKQPRLAIDLNNLAQLLQDTNRLDEAERLMRRALAIDEDSFGAEHPRVATDLNNLAQLLLATNQLGEAEPLMRRALAIDEDSFGMEHPNVSRDLNNLAQLLQATNRLDKAEPLMRRALAIDEDSFGAEHPDVAIDLNNLARLLQATHRLDEAEPLNRQMVGILLLFTMRTGHEHPFLNDALGNYGRLLAAMGHNEKQRQVMIEALIQSVKDRISS